MPKHPVIGIIMATKLEAAPFLLGLGLEKIITKPFPVYSNKNMVLMISGIGKANGAMAAAICMDKYKADILLNFGAAGALDPDYKIGEIFHINKIVEPDRPRLSDKSLRIFLPSLLKGFEARTLATNDQPILSQDARAGLLKVASLADMEGAAIVQAAKRFQKPCVFFKFITDTPDNSESKDIEANIDKFKTPFFKYIKKFVLDDPDILGTLI